METSLHRKLKEIYAEDAQTEVAIDGYRIDAVADDCLVEIQHSSLAAIRDKIAKLLKSHQVLVVKPIVQQKLLIKCDKKGGNVVDRRKSPKRGGILTLFEELVYFTRVFPHPNLTLEAVLVDVEEWRYPGHGRRRRRRDRDHQVEDQRLVNIRHIHRFQEARDLLRVIPKGLPEPFHTQQLAEVLGVNRLEAQRIAYCLRETGAAKSVGKLGNALLYSRK